MEKIYYSEQLDDINGNILEIICFEMSDGKYDTIIHSHYDNGNDGIYFTINEKNILKQFKFKKFEADEIIQGYIQNILSIRDEISTSRHNHAIDDGDVLFACNIDKTNMTDEVEAKKCKSIILFDMISRLFK